MTMRRPGDVHVALGPGARARASCSRSWMPAGPITFVNDLAQALAEVGVDITGNTPTLIDPQLVRDVDVVVTLGRAGRVHPVPGTRFEDWDTDERIERGIDSTERMRLVRDDTADRVAEFLKRMQTRSS